MHRFLRLTLLAALPGLAVPCLAQDMLVTSRINDLVVRYNANTGALIGTFASGGAMDNPVGIRFGPDGNVYVASGLTHQILKYSPTGTYLGVFASGGGLNQPRDFIFGPDGHLYVASAITNSVIKYDGASGAVVGTFASDPQVSGPVGLTFGPDGHLYVASALNDRVLRFDGTTGAFMGVFAQGGGLDNPTYLVFGPDGNLYVPSANTNQILRYNGTTGAFINVFASGGGLSLPISLAFGPDGHLYVGSANNDRVLRYNGTTGAFIGTFSQGGGLDNPNGMAFTPFPAPARGSHFIAQTPPPATMVAGSTANISISFKNVGTTTWTPEGKYYIGSRNPLDNTFWGSRRLPMATGASCPPGQTYAYTRTITAPWAPGTYNFQWKMVTIGGWFGDTTPNVAITVTRGVNAGTFVSQTGIPTTIAPGGTFTASITMKNTGTATWTTATGFRLGSWSPTNNTTWGSNRWDMPTGSSIGTDANVTFTRTFTAPTTPGTYTFQWRMIKSGVAFFGEVSPAVSIKVQ